VSRIREAYGNSNARRAATDNADVHLAQLWSVLVYLQYHVLPFCSGRIGEPAEFSAQIRKN
jgi:hypothetical protein